MLASLELLHVPSADRHIALVLVHAVGEALDVGGAGTVCLSGSALAVKGIGHGIPGLCVCVGELLLFLSGCGTTTAKETADGMAD